MSLAIYRDASTRETVVLGVLPTRIHVSETAIRLGGLYRAIQQAKLAWWCIEARMADHDCLP